MDISEFAAYIRSKSEDIAKCRRASTTAEYRDRAIAVYVEYIRCKPLAQQQRAARQAVRLARRTFFCDHMFQHGITQVSVAIALFPSAVLLHARARMLLYIGNWADAMSDLVTAEAIAGDELWEFKSRALHTWCRISYYRSRIESCSLRQPVVPNDVVSLAVRCGLACVQEDWLSFKTLLAGMPNPGDRRVICEWLRRADLCQVENCRELNGEVKPPTSIHTMFRMVKLLQLEDAVQMCESVLRDAKNERAKTRCRQWQSFLLACINFQRCDQGA